MRDCAPGSHSSSSLINAASFGISPFLSTFSPSSFVFPGITSKIDYLQPKFSSQGLLLRETQIKTLSQSSSQVHRSFTSQLLSTCQFYALGLPSQVFGLANQVRVYPVGVDK